MARPRRRGGPWLGPTDTDRSSRSGFIAEMRPLILSGNPLHDASHHLGRGIHLAQEPHLAVSANKSARLPRARALLRSITKCDRATMVEPDACTTMTQVRAAVDEIDRRIIGLIAERFRYMDAAARIKTERSQVRDDWRKADVLAKVDSAAAETGIDRALAARFYEDLIEFSIAHETSEWERLRS
jgi:isochorismate pyruvate lyase